MTLRWFFKEALRGFLPDEILAKQKHGFGLPFGPWLMRGGALLDMAAASLDGLAKRGIVRPEFLQRLIPICCRRRPDITASWCGS